MKHIALFIAAALPSVAFAQNTVKVENKVYVARTVTDAQGKKTNTLQDPTTVLPGEALAIILTYTNSGAKPAANFVIDNPIPSQVSYTGVEQTWAVVSVDGGKTFGALATLKVKNTDGTMRPALASDVDAVRWKFAQPIAAGATGRVMFYGTVK
jgi:uncharacterized repeat protein (TIGR01451 family)